MRPMAAIPESTRDSITVRLLDHAEAHWPQLTRVQVTYRGAFGYVTGVLRDGEHIPLCRRPRTLPRRHPAHRTANRHPARGPRHRLHHPPRGTRARTWPLTPDELTGPPTKRPLALHWDG